MTHPGVPSVLACCLVVALTPVIGAAEQQPGSVFPAGVGLVTVDVVITDGDRQPVTGLTRDDFTLAEDGRPQSVEAFEAIDARPPAARTTPPATLRVAGNTGTERSRGRTFVVVFDDLNLTAATAARARVAVERFLGGGLRDGDRVMLVATGGDAWWSARLPEGREALLAVLRRLQGSLVPPPVAERITPYEAMKIQVFRDREVAARVSRRLEAYGTLRPEAGQNTQIKEYRFNFEDPYLLALAANVYQQTVERSRATLDILERAIGSLAPVRGRKSVLLVSEGFIHDSNLDGFKRVTEAARRSNVALYFLDARGLEGLATSLDVEVGPPLEGSDFGAQFSDAQLASQGSEALAADSGGFSVKDTNDLGSGFDRIRAESDAYYLLGYRPANTAHDGRFRKIEVKVRRPGAGVRARKGYYARAKDDPAPAAGGGHAPPGSASADAELQRALDSPFDLGGLPLRLAAFVFDDTPAGKARVIATAEVDVRALAFEEEQGRLAGELQVMWLVARRDTGEFVRHDQKVELKFQPQARGQLARDGYTLTRDFELLPGAYQAKLVVRDAGSGRVGTLTHGFDVPEPGRFRLSTPILSDTLASAGGTSHPVLRLRRAYAPSAVLHGEFQVCGAARDAATGQPRVLAGQEVLRPDGTLVARLGPQALEPGTGGRLSHLFSIPLDGLPRGPYELVLRLRDGATGRDAEYREAFVVGEAGE